MHKARFVIAALGAVVFWGGVVSLTVNGRPLGAALAAEKQTEAVQDRSQALQPGAVVDLEQVSGPIQVRPAAGNVARLRAVISARGRSAIPAGVRVEISSDERSLRARAIYSRDASRFAIDESGRRWDHDDVEVSYTLELPATAQLRAKTVSGDIDVTGAMAGAQLRSVSGSVSLQRAAGDSRVESVSGDIKVGDVAGRLQIQTVSGDVSGALAAGLRDGDIQTVSGEVELTAPQALALGVRASTMSGEIHSAFAAGGSVPLRVHTLSGDISVKQR